MGKRWTVRDRSRNQIYLTEERWLHITESTNHPEMLDFEEHLKTTIKKGSRKQEPLNPRKYRYSFWFQDLPPGFNHIVAIVLFGFELNKQGQTVPNNYIATAFLKHMKRR